MQFNLHFTDDDVFRPNTHGMQTVENLKNKRQMYGSQSTQALLSYK